MAPGALLAALLLLLDSSPSNAQRQTNNWDRLLPDVQYFRPPIADPLEPRFGVALLRTDLLDNPPGGERPMFVLRDPEDAASDVVAAVALGLTFPIAQLKQWEGGGLILTGHTAVHSRFRIEYPSRDDMGQDWVVGGGIAAAQDAVSGRLRIHHRSSHIGDEFAQETGARRIEFGGEAIEGIAAYTYGNAMRVYGGGSWIFHSNTAAELFMRQLRREDRYTVQVGGDGEWFPWKNGRIGFNGGVDWQAAQRTNWRGAFAAAAGIHARQAGMLGFTVRYFTGPSTMGEFFLTRESWWSLELTGRF